MLDFDKLNILDSAQEVSDELLAAYIDGNTTEVENLFVEQHVDAEELDTISETMEDYQSFEEHIAIWDGDYGFWELGLPPVLTHDGEINTLNRRNIASLENNILQDSFISHQLASDDITHSFCNEHECAANDNLSDGYDSVNIDINNILVDTIVDESFSDEQQFFTTNPDDLMNL